MASIEKLIIKGFKAFPQEFELNFESKHLLLYGENGSGKSSIYYALHCLFQSPLKEDAGRKYFNRLDKHGNENNQHLLNLNSMDEDAKVSLHFDVSHPFIYELDKNGYNTELLGGTKPLPGNVNGVFINHKFLFHFFSFRNSEQINLFPLFEKDIIPYCNAQNGYCLDTILQHLKYAPKKGKRVDKRYYDGLKYFNEQLLKVIEEINLRASDIYNNFFKEDNDRILEIKLYYLEANDLPDTILNGYWLTYDYHKFIASENGSKVERRNTYRSLNIPFIRLEVSETREDGTKRIIPKPQAYFNEAKLTSIAMSVRFALLNLDAPADGRFLALDDMLISLDMSNRTKVIEFLLDISDKFKIYLLTHDRAFFELAKTKVAHSCERIGQKVLDLWKFKELYCGQDKLINPQKILSETAYARAKAHFNKFDYPAAANYLRKEVEDLMKTLPDKVQRNNGGDKCERLRTTLDNALELFKRANVDLLPIQTLIETIDTLLNPLSHNSAETDVFRNELSKVFKVIPQLYETIKAMSFKEVPRGSKMYLSYNEDEHLAKKIEIELTQELYVYTHAGRRNICAVNGKSLTSTTFIDGMDAGTKKLEHWKGSLENICQGIAEHKDYKMKYNGNYLDYYKYDDKPLAELMQ